MQQSEQRQESFPSNRSQWRQPDVSTISSDSLHLCLGKQNQQSGIALGVNGFCQATIQSPLVFFSQALQRSILFFLLMWYLKIPFAKQLCLAKLLLIWGRIQMSFQITPVLYQGSLRVRKKLKKKKKERICFHYTSKPKEILQDKLLNLYTVIGA